MPAFVLKQMSEKAGSSYGQMGASTILSIELDKYVELVEKCPVTLPAGGRGMLRLRSISMQ